MTAHSKIRKLIAETTGGASSSMQELAAAMSGSDLVEHPLGRLSAKSAAATFGVRCHFASKAGYDTSDLADAVKAISLLPEDEEVILVHFTDSTRAFTVFLIEEPDSFLGCYSRPAPVARPVAADGSSMAIQENHALRIPDRELDLDQDQTCSYKGKPFTGISTESYDDGSLRSERSYSGGLLNGPSRDWYRSGAKSGEDWYLNNQLHGKAREWHENGQPKQETLFEYGVALSRKEWDQGGHLVNSWEIDAKDPRLKMLERYRSSDYSP